MRTGVNVVCSHFERGGSTIYFRASRPISGGVGDAIPLEQQAEAATRKQRARNAESGNGAHQPAYDSGKNYGA